MNKKRGGCGEGVGIEHLARMARVLRLLAHPHRLKIIEILEDEHAAPVHDIVARLQLTQGATSQHLNQMRSAGLVRAERRGKEVWYGINDRRAIKILKCICGNEGKI